MSFMPPRKRSKPTRKHASDDDSESEDPNIQPTLEAGEVVLDRHGDLKLLVGPVKGFNQQFLISRRVMELTSPVWATMLDKEKGWAESATQQIHFKDDDPFIFGEVLRIAHQNHAKVENRITNQRSLFQLAIFCDKYDLGLFMRLFVVSWKKLLTSHSNGRVRVHTTLGCNQWLFIAWTFSLHDEFQKWINPLLHTIRYDTTGRLVDKDGRTLENDEYLPGIVIGK